MLTTGPITVSSGPGADTGANQQCWVGHWAGPGRPCPSPEQGGPGQRTAVRGGRGGRGPRMRRGRGHGVCRRSRGWASCGTGRACGAQDRAGLSQRATGRVNCQVPALPLCSVASGRSLNLSVPGSPPVKWGQQAGAVGFTLMCASLRRAAAPLSYCHSRDLPRARRLDPQREHGLPSRKHLPPAGHAEGPGVSLPGAGARHPGSSCRPTGAWAAGSPGQRPPPSPNCPSCVSFTPS